MKQINFKTLGGDSVSYPIRGKNYIVKRGYAAPPGTGPSGETCKTCRHRMQYRRWNKCLLARDKWTGGPASDILAGAAACRLWELK